MKKILIFFFALGIGLLTSIGLKNLINDPKPALISTSNLERTFAFIKPDAVAAKDSGKIIDIIEGNNFVINGMQKIQLSQEQAQRFYAVHKERPFFKDLITFMTSGPVIALVLQKENAVKAWRDLMGDTNPAKAAEGTLRKQFGTDITHNALHGSDSQENALLEMKQFFS